MINRLTNDISKITQWYQMRSPDDDGLRCAIKLEVQIVMKPSNAVSCESSTHSLINIITLTLRLLLSLRLYSISITNL
jgi:hypothetical protein